jgi:hypothetical protein
MSAAHSMYMLFLPYLGKCQSKCACGGFVSEEVDRREEAIRQHTVHVAQIGIYA